MATLTDEGYFEYLFDIRMKLIAFSSLILQKGQISYIRNIAVELRILLIDKSKRKCLLKEIENILNINICVGVKYSIKEKIEKGILQESFLEGLRFNQTNSVVNWFNVDERTSEIISLLEALNRKEELFINGIYFSYKELIETVSDKMGGAHIDHTVSDEKLIPHSQNILIGGMTPSDKAILDTCQSSIELINKIETFIHDHKETEFIRKQ